ncbi:MAG: hypothetical protein RL748_1332 [Pseudomonadota bacterium]|jgi:thimet oligopeptidase
MKLPLALATLCAISISQAFAAAAAPAAPPTAANGVITLLPAGQIGPHCTKGIEAVQAQIRLLEAIPMHQVNARTMLGGWNQLKHLLQQLDGPMELIAETAPEEAVRKAAEACSLKVAALPNAYLQNPQLYARIKAVRSKDPVDLQARQDILLDFEDRGIALPAAKRERAKAIFDQLEQLSQDFSRNTRSMTQKLAFSAEQLKGIPQDALKDRAKDSEGRYVFGMDYPANDAIMQNVEVEATRKAFYLAFNQRGGAENLALLKQATLLRRELAGLMAYDNYADWAIKRKMAGNAKAVQQFLSQVQAQVGALEKKEIAELRNEKAAFTGQPDAQLQRWDQMFYQQRLKKSRYSVDQQQVRAQFPTEATLAWMLKVSSTLYGVEFKENKTLPLWQQDVRAYDVLDPKSGKYLASFYLDLFPREGKYSHAAAFPVRRGSTSLGVTPISVLVTNFNRSGFDQNELETLFHEFGHILHGVLSQARYVMHSGTAVRRDFVEAPSQMYEEWSRRPESLALFAHVCPTCQPIDPQLIARMNTSRAFGQGLQYARQVVYAAWDMSLHTSTPPDPMAAWKAIESQSPLGHMEGSMVPASFGHIMSGYGAGYYGYMWSEVLALDMLSRYGENVMDTKIGARYRSKILARGGEQHPAKLVQAFLGRKPSPDAFFKEITGQRVEQKH